MRTALLAVTASAVLLLPSGPPQEPTTVDLTIHHSHFFPSNFTFPAGTRVRFVIHNTDPIDHEFIAGPEWVQVYMELSKERRHTGAVPGQISVPAETTRSTTYTVRRGPALLFGCHLPRHYAYGMRGSITVV